MTERHDALEQILEEMKSVKGVSRSAKGLHQVPDTALHFEGDAFFVSTSLGTAHSEQSDGRSENILSDPETEFATGRYRARRLNNGSAWLIANSRLPICSGLPFIQTNKHCKCLRVSSARQDLVARLSSGLS